MSLDINVIFKTSLRNILNYTILTVSKANKKYADMAKKYVYPALQKRR